MTSVNAELFHREYDPKPCIGNDPLCPCQDGDVCHYRDLPDSPAMPVPSHNPAPKE